MDSLKKIEKEILNCKKCRLWKTRKNPVVGEGNLRAKIIFIGEAPGASEDEEGRPFCGRAGKILNELFKKALIRPEDVYITNILKCRPPKNRDPKKDEISACSSFLERQINIIRPKIVCPLGRYSAKFIFEKYKIQKSFQPISKIHGNIFLGKGEKFKVKIVPFFHPALALYNPKLKKILEKDFLVLKKLK